MTSEYSEQELVEKTAIDLFKELGYEHKDCFDEFKSGVSFLGRENKSEVVLKSRLIPMLRKINMNLPEEAIEKAVKILTKDRSKLSKVKANEEVYKLIKNGVKVKIKNDEERYEYKKVWLIDLFDAYGVKHRSFNIMVNSDIFKNNNFFK